jgi:hypothetical protein
MQARSMQTLAHKQDDQQQSVNQPQRQSPRKMLEPQKSCISAGHAISMVNRCGSFQREHAKLRSNALTPEQASRIRDRFRLMLVYSVPAPKIVAIQIRTVRYRLVLPGH